MSRTDLLLLIGVALGCLSVLGYVYSIDIAPQSEEAPVPAVEPEQEDRPDPNTTNVPDDYPEEVEEVDVQKEAEEAPTAEAPKPVLEPDMEDVEEEEPEPEPKTSEPAGEDPLAWLGDVPDEVKAFLMQIWDRMPESMRQQMREGWESMSEEQRQEQIDQFMNMSDEEKQEMLEQMDQHMSEMD